MTRQDGAARPDPDATAAAVIDVGGALTLLGRCVFDPQQRPVSGRLVQWAIAHLVADGDCPGEPRVTMGALFALRAADRADRAGLSWERALFAAGRAVQRYLDLVPVGARERYGVLPRLVHPEQEVTVVRSANESAAGTI